MDDGDEGEGGGEGEEGVAPIAPSSSIAVNDEQKVVEAGVDQHGELEASAPGVVRVLRGPREPTLQEWQDHLAAQHFPFRIWCRHCVAGRGKPFQHAQDADDSKAIPTFSWDYGYMGDKDAGFKASEFCMVIGRDHRDKWVAGHPVPQKGVHNWVVQSVARDLVMSGHPRMILKHDQEASLKH